MSLTVVEMLQQIDKDPELLKSKYAGSSALHMIFEYAFIPSKKFDLPEGRPPFKPDPAPLTMSRSNFMMELRRLYIFTAERDLPKVRREVLFVQLLESIHPSEAEILLAIKDQTLDLLYKNITFERVVEAGFVPADTPFRVSKKKSDGAVKKSTKARTKKSVEPESIADEKVVETQDQEST